MSHSRVPNADHYSLHVTYVMQIEDPHCEVIVLEMTLALSVFLQRNTMVKESGQISKGCPQHQGNVNPNIQENLEV